MNKIWTEEETNFLKENYPKFGAKYCADKLGRSLSAVHNRCYLFKIKPSKETLKRLASEAQINYQKERSNDDFNVNVEQFLDITTPEVAYFLGFLWADGYIVRQEIRLSILSVDMETIKPTLDKIGKWNYNERVRGESKPICTAFTNNGRLFEFLKNNDFKIKSGTSANKILNKIPKTIKHYFFRGLIDGDGHIGKSTLTISSCFNQDWSYVQDVCKILDIKNYIYRCEYDSGKSSAIEMNGINGLKFGDYIYENIELENIGLPRKYEKYLELQRKVESGQKYVANKKKVLALEMYNDGFSIKDIMKEIEIPETTLRRFLNSLPT